MADDPQILVVRGLTKRHVPRGLVGRPPVLALEGVDLSLRRGSTLALVGVSGSGKSTLARCIVGLERPDSGAIWFDGENITSVPVRPKIQLVFQDPGASLNARLRCSELLDEPLRIRRAGPEAERRSMAAELMLAVGLPPRLLERRPSELSGGQRARLAIARALAMEPSLVVFDESFSALDFVTQARMLELLRELQTRYGLTYLIISHDFGLVTEIAGEVAVMHQGRIVEQAAPADLIAAPRQPATCALVDAITAPL